MEKDAKAGEREVIKASEECIRRNVESGLQFAQDTRKMVLELSTMFDALQNNVRNMHNLLNETRMQLANLQQQFYARGSVSYADGDKH